MTREKTKRGKNLTGSIDHQSTLTQLYSLDIKESQKKKKKKKKKEKG
jgi:hypothetical protein